ncbi:MAG: hypothetical protein V7638_3809 [Acidobacteriota bacterium]|jgi:hypothetical protein
MGTLNTTSKQFIVTATANADFRAIVQLFHDFFGTTCGFVQTGDTGQINPSTVNFPGANNTDAGSEYWGFNDSLQSTRPVTFKITYGRGNDANSWRITLSLGMCGTDGAGNFAGIVSGTTTYNFADTGTRTVADTTAYKVIGSGDTARFVICFFPNAASTPFGRWFFLERTRDADGTPNGNGVLSAFFLGGNNTTTGNARALLYPWGTTFAPTWVDANVQGWGVFNYTASWGSNANGNFGTTQRSQTDGGSTLVDGKIYAFPIFARRPGWKYPFTSIMSVAIADFPVDFTTVTIPFYGTNRTYIPLGPQMNGQWDQASFSLHGYIMRFESGN